MLNHTQNLRSLKCQTPQSFLGGGSSSFEHFWFLEKFSGVVAEYSIEKNTSFFGRNRRFSQYFELMVLHEFWSYADDQIVKIQLLDVKKPKEYIWSTSVQHVGIFAP